MIKVKDVVSNKFYSFSKTFVDEFVVDCGNMNFESFSTKYTYMVRYMLYPFATVNK